MGILTKALLSSSSGTKKASKSKKNTWNAKCPIFLGNFTPKTSHSCLKLWYTMFSRQLLFLDDFRFSHITALLLTQVSFGVFFFQKTWIQIEFRKAHPVFLFALYNDNELFPENSLRKHLCEFYEVDVPHQKFHLQTSQNEQQPVSAVGVFRLPVPEVSSLRCAACPPGTFRQANSPSCSPFLDTEDIRRGHGSRGIFI